MSLSSALTCSSVAVVIFMRKTPSHSSYSSSTSSPHMEMQAVVAYPPSSPAEAAHDEAVSLESTGSKSSAGAPQHVTVVRYFLSSLQPPSPLPCPTYSYPSRARVRRGLRTVVSAPLRNRRPCRCAARNATTVGCACVRRSAGVSSRRFIEPKR
jgi:hypothetical protein